MLEVRTHMNGYYRPLHLQCTLGYVRARPVRIDGHNSSAAQCVITH